MTNVLRPTSKVFLDTIPFLHDGRVAALGYFDGVHIGHQEIIKKVVKSAKLEGITSTLQTFIGFGKGEGRCLTTLEEKLDILTELGVDEMLVIDFSDKFKSQSPEQFWDSVIKGAVNAKGVFVGDDYTFGKMAAGNVDTLKQLGREQGIAVKVVPEKILEGYDRRVSSSWMREVLTEGDVGMYMKLTGGRPFEYRGRVMQGKQLGRQLGFPTANIQIAEDKFIVRRGVYVSKVMIGNKVYGGVTNVGLRPTVEDAVVDMVETYIFDFDEDIYGASIKVQLLDFLRPESRFNGKDELIAAVEANKIQAKTYLAGSGII